MARTEPQNVTPAPDRRDDDSETYTPPGVATGGFEALLGRVGMVLAQLLVILLTGRFMGPSGRGVYALASTCVTLCQVPFGSVWVANAVELARKRATPREVAGASIVVAVIGGALTAGVAWAISPLLGDQWWVLAVPSLTMPFVLVRAYQEGIFQALGNVRAVNVLRIGRSFLSVVFIAPPILAGASTETTIIIWSLSFVALAFTSHWRLQRFIGRPRFPRDRALYRRITTYGLTISTFRAVEVLNDRNGLVFLAIFADNAVVGVFSIAVAATEILLLSTDALQTSTFQRIGNESREHSAALTVRTTRHCILLALAASALVIPASYVFTPIILGDGYGEVTLLLALLVPNVVCRAAIRPLYGFFQIQAEKPGTMMRVVASALVASVATNAALVPVWGAKGAAIAASLAGLVAAFVAFRAFLVEAQARVRDLLPKTSDLQDYAWFARLLLRRLKLSA